MNIQTYIKMPTESKWWQKNKDIPVDINDVPIIKNTTNVKNSHFIELQNKIDSLVCEFIQSHNIEDAYAITYSLDNLQCLKNEGCNCPSCDGSLCVLDDKNNSIMVSI